MTGIFHLLLFALLSTLFLLGLQWLSRQLQPHSTHPPNKPRTPLRASHHLSMSSFRVLLWCSLMGVGAVLLGLWGLQLHVLPLGLRLVLGLGLSLPLLIGGLLLWKAGELDFGGKHEARSFEAVVNDPH